MRSNIIVPNTYEATDFQVCRLAAYVGGCRLSLAHDGVGHRNGADQFASGGEYLHVPHMAGATQVYRGGNTAHGVSVVSAGYVVA